MTMIGAPWICRRCLNASLKPGRRRLLRFQSTDTNASISPALLARARGMALEHDKLTDETTDTFDIKTSKRIGELKGVAIALKEWENATKSISELKSLLDDRATDAEMRELAQDEMVGTSAELDTISRKLTGSLRPKHPFEDMPCMIELRPGAGGGEAAIFAGDLLRMYKAYCTRTNLPFTRWKEVPAIQSSVPSSANSIAEAIFSVDSPGAYGQFRSEAGVHRVQRVPVTDGKGRIQTSAVSVLVLPNLPQSGSEGLSMDDVDLNDPTSDYYVNPTEVRTDVMRARGAGGQHVNTTDSAIRLTHLPTNTVVAIQDSRSQHQNRAKAWNLLRMRLAQARVDARQEEVMRLRRDVIGIAKMDRADKVRTYNYGQQRVTDHRSGFTGYGLQDVMEGGEELDKVIESVKVWLGDQEIRGLIADEEAASKPK